MRYPREHKAETHSKIVKAAARLFRERGYDGVGVDAIMNEVGLTAGGFYAHFGSKEALFAEAIGAALETGKAPGASDQQAAFHALSSRWSRHETSGRFSPVGRGMKNSRGH